MSINGKYSLPATAPVSGQFIKYAEGSNLTWDNIDEVWQFGSGNDALYEDGDVGIGLSNPIYRLDVEDNSSNGYVARFHNSSTSTTSRGIIIQAGPITNPSTSIYYALFLDGNGTNIGGIRGNGTGGTMYSTTSDKRLKQNIRKFDKGLATLNKINPAIYEMKSNPGLEEIGFIAQELYEVMPLVVGGSPTDNVQDSPMTVDYGRITPVLVAAIKEQQEIIKSLTERLENHDKQYDELKAEIAKIKGIAHK